MPLCPSGLCTCHCLDALPYPSFSLPFPTFLLPVQTQKESLIDLVINTKGYSGDTVLLISAPSDALSRSNHSKQWLVCPSRNPSIAVQLCRAYLSFPVPMIAQQHMLLFFLNFFFLFNNVSWRAFHSRTCAQTSSIPLYGCTVLHCECTETRSFL